MDLENTIPMPNDPTPFLKPDEADKGLLVKFYIKAVRDRSASAVEGRPVFKDVEYIDIKVPGSRNGVARPATYQDKQRFSEHYKAFKDRIDAPETGTPLAEWPPMSRSMVETLAFMNVKTVEQLAAVPDSSLPNVMGLSRFKQLAQQFMDAAAADAPITQMHAELEERDAKIDSQSRTIAALMERIEALEASHNAKPATEPSAPAEVPVEEPEPPVAYKSVLDRTETPPIDSPSTEEAPSQRPRRRGRPRKGAVTQE